MEFHRQSVCVFVLFVHPRWSSLFTFSWFHVVQIRLFPTRPKPAINRRLLWVISLCDIGKWTSKGYYLVEMFLHQVFILFVRTFILRQNVVQLVYMNFPKALSEHTSGWNSTSSLKRELSSGARTRKSGIHISIHYSTCRCKLGQCWWTDRQTHKDWCFSWSSSVYGFRSHPIPGIGPVLNLHHP